VTYEELLEKVRAAWEARIILTAIELGVPDALAGGAMAAAEAARALGADPRATDTLLNALAALGLAEKRDGLFYNAPVAEEYLTRTNYRHFVQAMYDMGWERANLMAQTVQIEKAQTLLDLGGGPGSYAIAFCLRYPNLKATVADLPMALSVATEKIALHGLTGRVSTRTCDFFKDDPGQGFELVILSHIIHSFGEADNRLLLAKIFLALAPGGRLILQDFFLDEDRCSPLQPALFSINMLVNTAKGRTYTWDEAARWLEEAGFRERTRLELPGPAGAWMARKP
jgi:ubiquinone/menaquinone biosynthesis C-methylase UbiE